MRSRWHDEAADRLEAELARWRDKIRAEAAKWPPQHREDFAQDATLAAIRAIRMGHGRNAGYMVTTITHAVEDAAEGAHLIRRRRLARDRGVKGAGRGVWQRDERMVIDPFNEETLKAMAASNDTEAEALAHIEAEAQRRGGKGPAESEVAGMALLEQLGGAAPDWLHQLDQGQRIALRDLLNLWIRRARSNQRRLPAIKARRDRLAAELAQAQAQLEAARQGQPIAIGAKVRRRTGKAKRCK